jgi:hypothetical protein
VYQIRTADALRAMNSGDRYIYTTHVCGSTPPFLRSVLEKSGKSGCFIAETHRMHLVLFGMQNRMLRPCLAASIGVLMSVALEPCQDGARRPITEMNGICLILFDMNNRILGPNLAAIHRILLSVMACWSCARWDHWGFASPRELMPQLPRAGCRTGTQCPILHAK